MASVIRTGSSQEAVKAKPLLKSELIVSVEQSNAFIVDLICETATREEPSIRLLSDSCRKNMLLMSICSSKSLAEPWASSGVFRYAFIMEVGGIEKISLFNRDWLIS